MRNSVAVVAAVLAATCTVWGATGADFDLKVEPAAFAFQGPPNSLVSGTADVAVLLTSRVGGLQGWSFAMRAPSDAGVTTTITDMAVGAGTLAAKNGGAPDFNKTAWYAADGTAADCAPACSGIAGAAVSQAIVIDFMAAVTLAAAADFEFMTLSVRVEGQVGDVDGEGNPVGPPLCGRLVFAEDVGSPPVASVMVISGASIEPAVLEGAQFCLSPVDIACAPPAQFTLHIGSAEGTDGASVDVPVVLNFNSDPANPNTGAVQGWSYGLCASGPVEITAAVLGADAAVVKNGAAPGFDVISIFPGQGVSHGLVIDMMAAITLPAATATAFEDLVLTLALGVTEDDPVAGISPCDQKLGSPLTSNVMVIGGASIQAQSYEGTLADRETETGCCDPAVCNTPGEYRLVSVVLYTYRPGNANGDRRIDIADGVFLLSYLFREGREPPCMAAADFNGDDVVDVTDALAVIYYQLQPHIPTMPAGGWPGPALGACGTFEAGTLSCDIEQEC